MYKVEKNVPIPRKKGKGKTAFLLSLDVGDSFIVTTEESSRVNNWYNLEIDADVEDSEHNYTIGGLVVSGLGDNVKLNNKYQRQPKELTLSLNN